MGNCCGSKLRHFAEQNYAEIKKGLGEGDLFEDDKFARSNLPSSLQGATWLRPQEICERLGTGGGPQMGDKTRKR